LDCASPLALWARAVAGPEFRSTPARGGNSVGTEKTKDRLHNACLLSARPHYAHMDIEYLPEIEVVLIYGHEPKIVAHFREQVAALVAERIESFPVHELPGFRSVDGCRLIASRTDTDFGIRRGREPKTFDCQLRPATWRDIEEMLEPFSDGSYFAASHQFLYPRGKIRLIISGGRGW